MNIKKKSIILVVIFIVLCVLAGASVLLLKHYARDTPRPHKTQAPLSMFEFAGAEGWMQGPSNATSMVLFNSQALDKEAPCFTSSEYYDGTVDISAQSQRDQQDLAYGGRKVTALGVKTLTIRTSASTMQYDIHMSDIAASGDSGKIMGGHAIGYAQLQSGYLKMYGNCNMSEDLPRTLPALEAVSVRL